MDFGLSFELPMEEFQQSVENLNLAVGEKPWLDVLSLALDKNGNHGCGF